MNACRNKGSSRPRPSPDTLRNRFELPRSQRCRRRVKIDRIEQTRRWRDRRRFARLVSPRFSSSEGITRPRFASPRGNSTISRHESEIRRARVNIRARKAAVLSDSSGWILVPERTGGTSGENLRPETERRPPLPSFRAFPPSERKALRLCRIRDTMDQGRNATS